MTNQNSKPKWTPGPWKAGWLQSYTGNRMVPCRYVYRSDDETPSTRICIWGEDLNEENDAGFDCDADAHLIAAAPELYEALDWFIDDIDSNVTRMTEFDGAVERARKALAKARGESND